MAMTTDPFAELIAELEEIAPLTAAQRKLLRVYGRALWEIPYRCPCAFKTAGRS